jgi:hypothetical protein
VNSNPKISQPPDLDPSAPAGFGSHNGGCSTAAGGSLGFTRASTATVDITGSTRTVSLDGTTYTFCFNSLVCRHRGFCVYRITESRIGCGQRSTIGAAIDAQHPCIVPAKPSASRMRRMHPMSQSFRCCCCQYQPRQRLIKSNQNCHSTIHCLLAKGAGLRSEFRV